MRVPYSLRSLTATATLLLTLFGCQALEAHQGSTGSGSVLALSSPSLDFGTVVVGSSRYQKVKVFNRGSGQLPISQALASNSDFAVVSPSFPVSIGAHASIDIGVRYTPHAAGSPIASLALTAGSHSTTVALAGTAVVTGRVVASPASVRFGTVAKGKSRSVTEAFTNTGSTSVIVSQAVISGPAFQLSGPELPLVLSPSQTASFTVVFAPQTAGQVDGTLVITSNAAVSSSGEALTHNRGHETGDTITTIPLAGTATGQGLVVVSPVNLNFSNVKAGSRMSQAVTLTNPGSSDVSISQTSASGTGFSVSGMGLPATLPAGQSRTLTVTYSAWAAGNQNGSLTIVSDAMYPVASIPLSATNPVAATPGVLSASLASMTFGSVQVGSSKTLTATLRNSGGTSVNVAQANLSGTGFSVAGLSANLTLNPGQSAPFSVTYSPVASGSGNGGLSVISDASNSNLAISFSGTATAAPTPGALASNLSALNFGSVQVGVVKTLSGMLTNSGGSPVNISQATVSGAGFSGPNLSLPVKLNPGQSAAFTVTYSPAAAGPVNGSMSIASDASNPSMVLSLAGSATAAPLPGVLVTSLSTLSFGSVQVGSSKALSGILSNTGGSPVTISQANVSGGGFAVSGLSFPLTLNPNENSTFAVTYSPFAIGNGSGSIRFVSNASNPALAVSLNGTAAAAPVPVVLTPSLSSLAFGNVQVGTMKSESETLTNFGTTPITVSQATLSGTGFTLGGMTFPLKLSAGQSANFLVTYAPTAAGNSSGTLVVSSDASNSSLIASLSGSGVSAPQPGVLSANAPTLNFGTVQVGANKPQSETLTNTGGSSVTISQASLSGVGFSLSGLYLPLQLGAGETFTFDVVFTPGAAASANGSLTLVSDSSNKLPGITLSGAGGAAGVLSVGPTNLSFGSVTVGASKNMSVTLSAANASVVVSSATVSSGEFTLSGPAFPLTISAGQSVPLTLTFTPQSSGSASASLTLASNTANGATSASLSGTGAAAAQHEVDLAWDPSDNAAGYNVYRGTRSGGPYAKLTGSTTGSPSFVDSAVQAGQKYFYVTTSVSSTNAESDYSNEVSAAVPAP